MTGIQKAALLLLGVAACQPAVNSGPAPAPATVRQVVTMQATVGETVVVAGRCLDAEAPTVALGSRPHSGSVWQLEDNGVAAWVSGPVPAGCSTGAKVAITAEVAQDTLPKFSPARTVRQYLVAR